MEIPFLKGVKELKCQGCGKKYPASELEEIMNEVNKGAVGLPAFTGLLRCLACWRKNHPKTIS